MTWPLLKITPVNTSAFAFAYSQFPTVDKSQDNVELPVTINRYETRFEVPVPRLMGFELNQESLTWFCPPKMPELINKLEVLMAA